MNLPLFFTLFFLLTLGSLWIGKKAAKNSNSAEDFLLSGRSIGLFPLIMTLLATQLGGGALMGAAEEAYVRGWSVLFYPLGMVVGLIVLGMGFGAKMRRLQLTTVAELFESVYGSISLRKFASLLSIVSLFLILTAQAIAARKFFSALGFETDLLFTIFWMILVAYTVMGGLKAVVQTDILQASFILIAFLATFIWLASKPAPLISTEMLPSSPPTAIPWLTWFLMPLLFMLIEQDMGQRCFAAKRPRTVSYASCIAGILLLVACLCPIYFGVLAGKSGLSIPEGSSVLITAVKTFTTPTFSTLLILSILMAIISTADSLLCSITSNLSVDFPIYEDNL